MLVACAGGAGCARDADGESAGARLRVEGVEVDVGHAAVEPKGLVGDRQGEGDRHVGLDVAEFACGDGDAGLAAAVDGVDGGGACGGADGDAEVDVAQVVRWGR